MNKLIAFVLLIALDAVIGQAHFFILHEDTYGASLLLQQFLLAAFIFYLIDYKYIVLKTISFIFMLSEIGDVVQYLSLDSNNIAPFVSVILFVPWLIYAIYRTYDAESVEHKYNTVFLLSKKPDNIWTFLPSLFSGTSGYSILCNRTKYGYHQGSFEISDFYSEDNDYQFITATDIKYSKEIINYLESKESATWRIWDNCITVHFKLKYLNWKAAHV